MKQTLEEPHVLLDLEKDDDCELYINILLHEALSPQPEEDQEYYEDL